MEGPYGSEWPMEEKVKRREMVAPEARYIFVRESPNAALDGNSFRADDKTTSAGCMGRGDHLVGFVHYRFIVEEDIPVVYVYELQLESCAQGKGLGKFLMQLIELIAHKVFIFLIKLLIFSNIKFFQLCCIVVHDICVNTLFLCSLWLMFLSPAC